MFAPVLLKVPGQMPHCPCGFGAYAVRAERMNDELKSCETTDHVDDSVGTSGLQIKPHAHSSHTPPVASTNDKAVMMNKFYDERRFCPPSYEWQRNTCRRLSMSLETPVSYGVQFIPLSVPATVKKIAGDGNCLFRSISFCLTGSEKHHGRLRQALMYYYMFKLDAGKVRHHLADTTMTGYEKHYKSVGQNGTWGTDADILAFSSYLNIEINVYGKRGTSGDWCWYTFKPDVYGASRECPTAFGLYIQNTNGNHYDVVTAVNIELNECTHRETFLPPDVNWQNKSSDRLSLNWILSVDYEGIGSPVGYQFNCTEQAMDFYSVISFTITGCIEGATIIRDRVCGLINKHERRIKLFLKENETLENHCSAMNLKSYHPDRIDILATASLLKTDVMIFDNHHNLKSQSASWRLFDSGELFGNYRDKANCCIYLKRIVGSGYVLVLKMDENTTIDFGGVHIPNEEVLLIDVDGIEHFQLSRSELSESDSPLHC